MKYSYRGAGAPPEPEPPGEEPASDERRQWPRVRLRAQVRLRFADPASVLASEALNLSEGGAFVRVPAPRPVGTHVRLVLEIGDRALQLGGTVVRTSAVPPGMGIQFEDVDADDRAYLAALLAKKAP